MKKNIKIKKVLFCAATIKEIQPLIKYLKAQYRVEKKSAHYWKTSRASVEYHLLITGVGMISTAYALGKLYTQNFSLVINAGIAGSFDKKLNIGEVVVVQKEILSEFGAEDGKKFIKASEIGLGNEIILPKKLYVPSFFSHLKKVNAITVNTVHGYTMSINRVIHLFEPQIETMEGAAFYYACNQNKWPSLELRSISNYVEKRNTSQWNIPLAIKNLNELIIQYIHTL